MLPFAPMAGRNALAPPILVAAGGGAPTPASQGAQVGDLMFFDVYGSVGGGSGVVQVADTVYAFITASNINAAWTGSIASFFILRGVRAARTAVASSGQATSGFVKSPNYIGLVSMTVTGALNASSVLAGSIAMTQRAFYSGNGVYKYYHSLFRPAQPSDYVDLSAFKVNIQGGTTGTPSQVIELLG